MSDPMLFILSIGGNRDQSQSGILQIPGNPGHMLSYLTYQGCNFYLQPIKGVINLRNFI